MSDRGFPRWEELYRNQSVETMPWYFAGLDPDLERALRERGIAGGRVLDIGTGPGTQAVALAERGFDVVGTDVSQTAVEKAVGRSARVRFVQDDILNSKLDGPFDVVLDRGCFHVLDPAQHARYVEAVARLLRPGGCLFLKCFSEEQPGTQGPYRFRPEEIPLIFAPAFDVLSIDRTVYHGTLDPKPRALFCAMVKPQR